MGICYGHFNDQYGHEHAINIETVPTCINEFSSVFPCLSCPMWGPSDGSTPCSDSSSKSIRSTSFSP
jgi:hypothetical protein